MQLVLPNNYVELEQEEMMYLDGGGNVTRTTSHWWGIRRYMNRTMTNDTIRFFENVAFGAAITAGALKLTGLGGVKGTLVGIAGAQFAQKARRLRDRLNETTNRGTVLDLHFTLVTWATRVQ